VNGLPMVFPEPGLPSAVTVYEVGARDGLQNESTVVPTAVKAEFVRRLADAGLRTIEATSFVPAKWVPQLGDAEELFAEVRELYPAVDLPVLVPNERGLDRALALGARHIAVFGKRHRDLRRPQPQPHGERLPGHVRTGRRARNSRGRQGPRLPVDVLRRPLGGPGRPGPGGRCRCPSTRHGLPATQPRRHRRRRHPRPSNSAHRGVRPRGRRRGTAGRALPRHVRPGTGQHSRRTKARR